MHTATASTINSTSAISGSWIGLLRLQSIGFISLVLVTWISAFAVVFTTFSTRHTFAELQSLRQEHDNLFLEWTQLLLEQGVWADTGQIEQLAREELYMRLPTIEEVNFLVVEQ